MLQTLLLLTAIMRIHGTFIVHRVKIETNENIFNITVSVFNDGVSDSVSNITITNYEVIQKLIMYLTVSVPRDAFDKKFQKEFLKTTIDVGKLHRGVAANFVGKLIIGDYFNAMSHEPEFPIQKKTVRITNLTFSDLSIPLLAGSEVLISVRGVGRIPRNKTNFFFFSADVFTEMKR